MTLSWHIQNPAILDAETHSKHCQISRMMRHLENFGITRTVYSGIFGYIYLC